MPCCSRIGGVCAMIFLPWKDPKYWENKNGEWDFMPPEHRPGGARFLHDDWNWPFCKIPRTYTSFVFLGWDYVDEETYFEDMTPSSLRDFLGWGGMDVPRSWQEQKILVKFKDPFGVKYEKIYQCSKLPFGYYRRTGPRISEGWEDGIIEYCYVDWFPGGLAFCRREQK